jgi:secretion/DNA translocation related TadE-like protein
VTPGRCRRARGDSGTATALVLGLAAVLLLLGAVATALGAVAVARHRAASAADLSALAAAAAVLDGPEVACDRARALATEVSARLSSCRVEGDRVLVVAEVRPPGALGRLGAASVRAAAGPVPGGWVSGG